MTRRQASVLVMIVAVGAVVRFASLDVQSYHHDEAVTAGRVIQPGLLDTLEVVRDSERSPPLYYLLAWAWTKPFGTGEVGLRSLSALIGLLLVPAAFLAGTNLASKRVGIVAAALFALNPYLIWYSQEARSYILMVLFATLALAFFARAVQEPSKRQLALWAAAAILAITTHYFAVFFIAPQVAWLLYRQRSQVRSVVACSLVVLTGCLLLPLALAQQGGDRRDGFTEISPAVRAGETVLNFVASEEPDPLSGTTAVDFVQLGAAAAGGLLLSLVIVLIVRRGTPRERSAAATVALLATITLAAPFVLAVLGVDFANPRNLIVGLVPLLLLAALGLGGERGGKVAAAGAAAACALFALVGVAVLGSDQMQRPNWRGVAEAIGNATEPRLIVAPRNGDDPLALYLDGSKFKGRRARSGVEVREVEVVSTTPDITPPKPPFRLVTERRLGPLFFLRSFRSRRPQRLQTRDVDGSAILRERSAALIERGG
jgi:mannosyltransferase